MTVLIGFSFNFYGTNHGLCNICTNGFISFVSTSTEYSNTCLPNSADPNGIVAGYWDDLTTPPGSITYQTLGVAPNRRFVVHWNNVGHHNATSTLENFKIILNETTNVITTTIISSMGGGASATRGVESQSGAFAMPASCNQAGSAIALTSQTYTPYSGVLPSADLAVTGSTGPNGVLTWSINSNALLAPVAILASLDPGPVNLGPLGIINLGLAGPYAVIADGAGVLATPNPAAFTDAYCGDYQVAVPLGPIGLPPGLTIFTQGVVLTTTSVPPPPNGQFHITTPITINT
jgi:hypothetical protein